ncbi:GATA zinc finger domain-containing protein 12-like [Hibiscus syriacus]|uniref:GATA zinc finger domain-containing protein 12-like n=1 Tax=Hibiscus syriacus TaxID=106335 RepID=A0A6A3B7S6_HIBSY|nr:GATA zinc finger domain-containing protein 12-like [Hibiscus syriacus]
MVENDSIIVLNTKLAVLASETLYSSDSNYKHRPSKRARHDHGASLVRFKGVVPQQNGHWGAQIYANHQRIWLGTFKSKREAAMAYDSAAIKIRRGGDTHRNLPWTDLNVEDFVKILPKKDGKLATNLNKKLVHGDTHFSCMQLFLKELTPSDVGKLNRLVIPKKYPVKHFHHICETDQQSLVGGIEYIELVFYDKLMMTWRFRYCYWRSSQSFVFTRGWSRFVKEKKLGEKDSVTFCACECPGGSQNGRNFFHIDVDYNGESCCIDDVDKKRTNTAVELELNLGNKNYTKTRSIELNEDRSSFRWIGIGS